MILLVRYCSFMKETDVQRSYITHYSCSSRGSLKYTHILFILPHVQWWDLILFPWSVADFSDLLPINGICRNDDLWLLKLGHKRHCGFSFALCYLESSVSRKPAGRCADSQADSEAQLPPTNNLWMRYLGRQCSNPVQPSYGHGPSCQLNGHLWRDSKTEPRN